METTVKIDLQNETCDIEVKGLPLTRINSLSATGNAVAESLVSALTVAGMESGKAREGVSLLLQGKIGIQCILKAIP